MDLVTPALGLTVWTTVVFTLLVFLLGKFAWKPILSSIKEREASIDNALKSAERAKAEMQELQAGNEKLLVQARAERDQLLKEARDVREQIIAEAKTKASSEAEKLVANARITIQNEKNAAISELKSQVATMSIEIAEKIIRTELATDEKQKALVSTLMKDVNLN